MTDEEATQASISALIGHFTSRRQAFKEAKRIVSLRVYDDGQGRDDAITDLEVKIARCTKEIAKLSKLP